MDNERIEEFWPSIADMMAGLMLVFLLIAVVYIKQVSQQEEAIAKQKEELERQLEQKEVINNMVGIYRSSQINLNEDIEKEFTSELDIWDAKVGHDNSTFTFNNPEMFFERGRANLTPEFKKILDEFFPRYIKILHKEEYRDKIDEIRIEGHTSSEWNNQTSMIDSYFYNMKLSQERTRSVLEYVMKIPEMNSYKEFLISYLTANGLSYSKKIVNNGIEDKRSSRRVEFKIRTASEDLIKNIIKEVPNDMLD